MKAIKAMHDLLMKTDFDYGVMNHKWFAIVIKDRITGEWR